MHFDGRFAAIGLVFSNVNDTVDSEAEPLREPELMPSCLNHSILYENVVHGSSAIDSGWTLRPGEYAPAG